MNSIYYGGLFLVFSAGYFMLAAAGNDYSIIGGFSILAVFVAGAWWTDSMNLFVFSATLFLLAENVLGSIGSYQLEKFRRSEFLQLYGLEQVQKATPGIEDGGGEGQRRQERIPRQHEPRTAHPAEPCHRL
ncbi:MAG: hypothetical protein MZV64_09230 [Ignavibacteriales bacterium]|nr:hypothetical protein [Ignavibacteriales bacterium]